MNNKTTILQDLFANGFVRLPRKVVNNMFSEDSVIRNYFYVYAALLILAHPKKFVVRNKKKTFTYEVGDYLVSHRELSRLTGIASTNIGRCIKELEQDGLVTTRWVQGKTLFHVNYYNEITHHYVEIGTGEDKPSTGGRKQSGKAAPDPDVMTAEQKQMHEENMRIFRQIRERQKKNQL